MEKITLWQRLMAPTPKFFKKLRNIGVLLTIIGAAMTKQEIVDIIPFINKIGIILAWVGTTTSLVSQSVTKFDDDIEKEEE